MATFDVTTLSGFINLLIKVTQLYTCFRSFHFGKTKKNTAHTHRWNKFRKWKITIVLECRIVLFSHFFFFFSWETKRRGRRRYCADSIISPLSLLLFINNSPHSVHSSTLPWSLTFKPTQRWGWMANVRCAPHRKWEEPLTDYIHRRLFSLTHTHTHTSASHPVAYINRKRRTENGDKESRVEYTPGAEIDNANGTFLGPG